MIYAHRNAERVLFRERFADVAKVHANGGIITGGAVPDHGIPLDGSTQSVFYSRPALFGRPQLSGVIKLSPEFNLDEGVVRYLFSSSGADYFLRILTGGDLTLRVGGTNISVLKATVEPYWLEGETNIFAISAEDGNTKIWLNSTNILDSAATWTPIIDDDLYVGAYTGSSNEFKGTYYSIDFREGLLTQLDVDAIEDGSLWTYTGRANLWLDMAEATERDGLKQTLDKSPNGHVCLLGDGSTPAGIPDFKNPGFEFNASSHYMTIPQASGIFNNVGQSMTVCFEPDFPTNDGVASALFDAGTPDDDYFVAKLASGELRIEMGNLTIEQITESVYSPYWIVGGRNVLIVAGTSGNTWAWLNGFCILQADTTTWSPTDIGVIYLGRLNAGVWHFGGRYHAFILHPFQLSPLQARDLTERLGVTA